MTPAEHYAAAERLLSTASYFTSDPGKNNEARSTVHEAPLLTAQAQVHATLAAAPWAWERPKPTPGPLYVNHPRPRPAVGDVVRSAAEDEADDASTWMLLPYEDHSGYAWWGVTSREEQIRVQREHLPERLLLLVDGETGQVVQ